MDYTASWVPRKISANTDIADQKLAKIASAEADGW